MDKYTLLPSPSLPSIILKMKVLYQNLNDLLTIFTYQEEKVLANYGQTFLAMLNQFEKGLFQLTRTPYFSKEEIEAYVTFLAKIYESLDYNLSPVYKVMLCLFIDMGEKEKASAAYEKWYYQSLLENDTKINGAEKFLDRQYLARFFAFMEDRDSAMYYLASTRMILKHIRRNPIYLVDYLSLANYLKDSRLKLALIRQIPVGCLCKCSALMQFWYGVSFKSYSPQYAKELSWLAQVLDRRNQNTYYQDYLVKGSSRFSY